MCFSQCLQSTPWTVQQSISIEIFLLVSHNEILNQHLFRLCHLVYAHRAVLLWDDEPATNKEISGLRTAHYTLLSVFQVTYHIISYHIISYHITSNRITPYRITYHTRYIHRISYHILPYRIVSCIISFHFTTCRYLPIIISLAALTMFTRYACMHIQQHVLTATFKC